MPPISTPAPLPDLREMLAQHDDAGVGILSYPEVIG